MGEGSTAIPFNIEVDSLALTQQTEHAARQGSGPKVNLTTVLVDHDNPGAGTRIVDLYHSLHGGQSSPFRWVPPRLHTVRRVGPAN